MEEVNNKVRLEFNLHEYRRIAMVMREHKSLLYKLKMNELLKKGLIKGVNVITDIFERAEVKARKEGVGK